MDLIPVVRQCSRFIHSRLQQWLTLQQYLIPSMFVATVEGKFPFNLQQNQAQLPLFHQHGLEPNPVPERDFTPLHMFPLTKRGSREPTVVQLEHRRKPGSSAQTATSPKEGSKPQTIEATSTAANMENVTYKHYLCVHKLIKHTLKGTLHTAQQAPPPRYRAFLLRCVTSTVDAWFPKLVEICVSVQQNAKV
ncbi:hypothetical protein AMECASPLE_007483 [Ameca splendens]|uniref:Uncharacterized protein n=1 Tax=Ameca splendens TaxID=208324 RepID=A0ABV0ZVL8_9TELE